MNVSAIAVKTGRVWHDQTSQYVNHEVDMGIQRAQGALQQAIKGRTPTKTGELQRSIIGRGKFLARTVRMDLARGIPLDTGWMPASKRRAIVAARLTYKLKGKRKLIRALKGGKVAGRHFFLHTFRAMEPMLYAQYLAPVGVGIIRALEA